MLLLTLMEREGVNNHVQLALLHIPSQPSGVLFVLIICFAELVNFSHFTSAVKVIAVPSPLLPCAVLEHGSCFFTRMSFVIVLRCLRMSVAMYMVVGCHCLCQLAIKKEKWNLPINRYIVPMNDVTIVENMDNVQSLLWNKSVKGDHPLTLTCLLHGYVLQKTITWHKIYYSNY